MRMRQTKSLVGERFGFLVVMSEAERLSAKNARWNCVCDCGNTVAVQAGVLKSGRQVSCGCYHKREATTHGMEGTLIYTTWSQMKARCLNKGHKHYGIYGGRGITVCKKWLTFEGFFEDMGEKPEGKYSLDRIDNNGGYSKENCRWADAKTQNNNRSNNRLLTVNGVTQSLTLWAEQYGISPVTVRSRLKLGWNTIDALSHPVDKRKATKAKLTR